MLTRNYTQSDLLLDEAFDHLSEEEGRDLWASLSGHADLVDRDTHSNQDLKTLAQWGAL